MRALILGLSVLAVASARIAEAGLTTTPREQSVSADTATIPEETNQETEDKIGLTRTKRRKIQRELTSLGFETRTNGKFDDMVIPKLAFSMLSRIQRCSTKASQPGNPIIRKRIEVEGDLATPMVLVVRLARSATWWAAYSDDSYVG